MYPIFHQQYSSTYYCYLDETYSQLIKFPILFLQSFMWMVLDINTVLVYCVFSRSFIVRIHGLFFHCTFSVFYSYFSAIVFHCTCTLQSSHNDVYINKIDVVLLNILDEFPYFVSSCLVPSLFSFLSFRFHRFIVFHINNLLTTLTMSTE